ncbi:MAG: DNA polymerase IV [Gemmatimonas sp.]|jgi:DNA polymerase-4|uniref:DNA polymerase Y family protein n=1 Tax=Gemmatimonas sp. TaxID=1962908 RepID=UPI00391F5F85|nr:DNA polymerase IV [Gemmatimonadota bacterium]
MTSPRRILLVDADAFFVAVARQEDPEGAGRARLLIVGGRPGSRGVVCSASYECRAFGVRSAMPIARALRLCPEAMCVPVPRHACSLRSREIHAVLSRFAPVVQASSIDEWYCDLGGTEALYGYEPLRETAHRIRDAVREATGLPVSLGGGTSRLIAKMAVEVAKPKPGTGANGVHCVAPGEEVAFLSQFRLADLPMVGPRLTEQLARLGLVSVREAQAWSEADLVRRLGDRAGPWLARRVRGIDDSVVSPRDRQKQVSREDTFARDLDDDDSLERELLRLAVRVSADLRRQALRARTVTVKIKDTDFRTRSAQRTLESFIESERSVAAAARPLLRQLRGKRRVPVRLLGIALSHFDDEASASGLSTQLGLFGGLSPDQTSGDQPRESPRDRALTRALDRIRDRYGREAIVPARLIDPAEDTGPRVEE